MIIFLHDHCCYLYFEIIIIKSKDSTTDTCDAALALLHHVRNEGNTSDFAPYLDYLYRSENIPSIPSTWSLVGKAFLKTIQGSTLIPQDITELSFFKDCIDLENEGYLTDIEDDQKIPFETAYAIALTRSWDEKLVPVLDMFNHHPQPNIVVDDDDDKDAQTIKIFAKTDIRRGDQLYTDYRNRSQDSIHHVSTLLRDFGFVEDYPQQWKIPTPEKRSNIEENNVPVDIRFDIVRVENEDGERYDVNWVRPVTPLVHPVAANHLKKELARIRAVNLSVVETAATVASESERETILGYYRSLVIAYETVISSVEQAIELSPGIVENPGDDFMACNDFVALHDETYGWEYFEATRSSHQAIDYYYNRETRDACLFLESYLHACVSNRPHYHEVFVHYPAHFLEKVERVLFIGGGDSMVLHEVLKYDDQLELVVGLELDQHVVRNTFSRIGTQPHFHNDKVEWWFGDAAEALNVLPTEYYGTFDLVVVDILSEVAESLQVTDHVTIMEAAMMLMKPNGIIVKNEDEGYVPGSTNSTYFTDHTIDVMYYDVPVYCLQTFVVGSNTVDFSTAKPKDHKISNFYLKDVDEFQAQFDTWYTWGNEVEDSQKEEDDDSSKESNTSALTMIIEAEQISVPISMTSASSIQQIIHESVKTVGFSVNKSSEKDLVDGYHLVSVLEEGIITARCFPEKKYCAIDVQLWKSAHKAESMKKALLSGLKSEENSVYRVVTTGVFGVEENNNNKNKIGPPSKKAATSPENTPQDDRSESENISAIQTSFTRRKNPEIDFKNATFDDYDSVSALAQWHSQEPLGHQTIVRYELPFEYDFKTLRTMLSDIIYDALDDALEAFEDESKDQIMVEDFKIGAGLVIVAIWSEGSIVCVWDGEERFDLNIFSLIQSAHASMGGVAVALGEYLKLLSTDVFPRGTGRVINPRRDFSDRDGNRFHPLWAPQIAEANDDGEL